MVKRSKNSLVEGTTLELCINVLRDLQLYHPFIAKDLSLDSRTVSERVKHEGLSFLTCSMPTIGKALQRALQTGIFDCPQGFRKIKGTAIPRFLGGMLKRVVDEEGLLLPSPDPVIVNDIIQLTLMFAKIDLPTSPEKERKVIANFVNVENELKLLTIKQDNVIEGARAIIAKIFEGFDPFEIKPQHGPGAVATGEKHERKWTFRRKYENIHSVYPYYEYFVPSRSFITHPHDGLLPPMLSWYKSLEPCTSGVAKVRLVPKDSRGPRLISMEPLEYQFVQQGLGRAIVKHVEKESPITRGFVNFTDQSINQDLAKWNSVTGVYSTLDLKDASDRVSLSLVYELFKDTPKLYKALLATRTTHTELPDGTVLPLAKFAPMGSALCFPVEALVFFALSTALMRREGISGRVYVYGDDLIVPTALSESLFDYFPTVGLKFNEDKCFTRGYFRESCGFDAYKGEKITPIRMRKIIPWSLKQAKETVAAVDFSNRLYERGFWRTAAYLRSCLGFAGVKTYTSPSLNYEGLSYTSFTSKGVTTEGRTRFNRDLQKFETRSLHLRVKTRKWKPSVFGRMFEGLTGRFQKQYTVPHAVSLQMRWTHLYG